MSVRRAFPRSALSLRAVRLGLADPAVRAAFAATLRSKGFGLDDGLSTERGCDALCNALTAAEDVLEELRSTPDRERARILLRGARRSCEDLLS